LNSPHQGIRNPRCATGGTMFCPEVEPLLTLGHQMKGAAKWVGLGIWVEGFEMCSAQISNMHYFFSARTASIFFQFAVLFQFQCFVSTKS